VDGQRQAKHELRAARWPVARHDRSAEPGDGAARHGEPQARPFFLVVKNARTRAPGAPRDARALVGYGHHREVLLAPHLDGDGPAQRHRVARIEQEVHEEVLELRGGCAERRQLGDAGDQADVPAFHQGMLLQLGARQRQRLGDDHLQLNGLERFVDLPAGKIVHPGHPHGSVIDDRGERF